MGIGLIGERSHFVVYFLNFLWFVWCFGDWLDIWAASLLQIWLSSRLPVCMNWIRSSSVLLYMLVEIICACTRWGLLGFDEYFFRFDGIAGKCSDKLVGGCVLFPRGCDDWMFLWPVFSIRYVLLKLKLDSFYDLCDTSELNWLRYVYKIVGLKFLSYALN